MDQKNPDDISFQITGMLLCILFCHHTEFSHAVGQLTVSLPLAKQDICVTVTVNDISKITCPGELSGNGFIVTWNHPFLL